MIQVKNIYREIPKRTVRPTEHIEEILAKGNVKMERIVTYGKPTPEGEWYDSNKNEFVIVLRGQADLLFEDGNRRVKMMVGDYINIPPHARHRVERVPNRKNTDTIWFTVYY